MTEQSTLAVPDCVPARMVNEFAYCPRLAYIEWVQSEFADNFETVDGRYKHRAVEKEKGGLPVAGEGAERIHARSVWLSAPNEHLTAKIDLIEGEGGRVTPVDYKRGSVPDNPEHSWEADRVQVCVQGLVLRENGYSCDGGVIYYAASKTRVPVAFDDELAARTRELVAELRRVAASEKIPPPLEDSPKCPRCSLVGICLPDETNLLAGEERPVRRLLPSRDDSLPLYVQEQGAYVGKRGEVFQVKLKGKKVAEARIFETSQVCVFGNVQVSTQAVREMCARGIPLVYYSTGGWFYGMAHGMSHKNVELRRTQYAAAEDGRKCLALATAFVAAKIENCRTMLRRNCAQLPEDAPVKLSRLADKSRKVDSVESLLGVEGMAAKIYFSDFAGMLKGSDEWAFDFNGRNRRPPLDPVNAMLSYAYSLLLKDLTVTLLSVGFDPFLGFYHRPRYGRPALALDLMEEFRPIIADSVVLWTANNGVLSPSDFVARGPAVSMSPKGRKKFIQAYEKRLNAEVTHPVFGYRISYRRVLEVQARLLARVLSGEIGEYPAFRTR